MRKHFEIITRFPFRFYAGTVDKHDSFCDLRIIYCKFDCYASAERVSYERCGFYMQNVKQACNVRSIFFYAVKSGG